MEPGEGTRLELVRSIAQGEESLGDYAVTPVGWYGIEADRLLRVDCATGRPLGAVPR